MRGLGLSLIIRAQIAREQARRARFVAAQVACAMVRERLQDCAEAWERDASLFETVSNLPGRPVYLNELNRDIL